MNKEECIKHMISYVEEIEMQHNIEKLNADQKERKLVVNAIKNELERVTKNED